MIPAQAQFRIGDRFCKATQGGCLMGHVLMRLVFCGIVVFFGGCIVRVAPDGQIDRVVEMPVQNITTCTFGDADRNIRYIATASIEAPTDDRLAEGRSRSRPRCKENRKIVSPYLGLASPCAASTVERLDSKPGASQHA